MPFFTPSGRTLIIGTATIVGLAAVGGVFVARYLKSGEKSRGFDMVLLEELQRPCVHMKDRDRVEGIIRGLIQDGRDKLQVIADFDRTLSTFMHNGRVTDTCYNALDDSKHLPDSYRTRAKQVRNHYYPMEVDPHLTLEQKYPIMVEWWTKAHDLLLELNITKDLLKKIAQESFIVLREGSDWLFQELHTHQVPLLIFSAGIGDVIEQVIRHKHTFYDNMRVVSNYMDFDSQGVLTGFKGELIHVFNKNESAIHKSNYFENIRERENIVLMGDSLGDLRMADGATNTKNILRIGFLNDKIEERLSMYMDAFDIVLVSDETLDIPNAIIRQIL